MFLINYSNKKYRRAAIFQGVHFILLGGKHFKSFSYEDLPEFFTKRHARAFNEQRGAGYWIWKPKIIQQALELINDDEILLYLDSGINLLKSPEDLIRGLESHNIILWNGLGKNKELIRWCHPSVFAKISRAETTKHNPILMAGAIIIRKNHRSVELIAKWMELCENEEFLFPDLIEPEVSSDSYIWHRHDSSLLSILAHLNSEDFLIKDSDHFQTYFDLHRKSKPFFKVLRFRSSFYFKLRLFIVKHMPQFLTLFIRKSKFLVISSKRNLTKSEVDSHKKLF